MFKRFVVLMLAVALVATMSVAGAAQTKKQITIGISCPAADHGWTAGIIWWAKKAMAEHKDVKFYLVTAENPTKQIADVEDLMTKGIDALVILPTESAPLTPICEKVHEKGIFIVNVDRGLLSPVADVYVAGDNYLFGKMSAEFMAKKLNGKGNVVVLEGIPCTVNTERVNGFNDVMKKYPNIKILASQPAHWRRDKGLTIMENYLQTYKKIDAVWAADDDVALGVIQAIKEAGREKEMFVVPGAGMKDVVKMVMDGSELIPCDVTYPPAMMAVGVNLAVMHLKGESLPGFYGMAIPSKIILQTELITKENAKKFYYPDSIY